MDIQPRHLPRTLFVAMAIALAPFAARAATTPPGVNLNWDQCFGDGSIQYKQFACDTNTGTERLFGSFELASDFPGIVTGVEINLSLGSLSSPLPAWWQYFNAGSCRQTALSAQVSLPPGAASCVDWAEGTSAGGVAQYALNTQGTNHARINLGSAVAGPINLFAGQEYFAFRLSITHAKTVGTGACAGCLDPVVIFLSAVKVVPGTGPSLLLTQGANYSGSDWVSWQQGYPTNIQHGCSATGGGLFCLNPSVFFDVVPYSVTPARASTWGQVKSLYR